jgi:hypothetical protein
MKRSNSPDRAHAQQQPAIILTFAVACYMLQQNQMPSYLGDAGINESKPLALQEVLFRYYVIG